MWSFSRIINIEEKLGRHIELLPNLTFPITQLDSKSSLNTWLVVFYYRLALLIISCSNPPRPWLYLVSKTIRTYVIYNIHKRATKNRFISTVVWFSVPTVYEENLRTALYLGNVVHLNINLQKLQHFFFFFKNHFSTLNIYPHVRINWKSIWRTLDRRPDNWSRCMTSDYLRTSFL